MNTWVHLHPWMAIAAVALVAATLAILFMALLAISRDADRRVDELMGRQDTARESRS